MTPVDAFAQDIKLMPQLRPGDEFRLEVTRIRGDSTLPQQSGRSRTVVEVHVLSATPEGFVLDWQSGDTVLENAAAAQDPMVAIVGEALRGVVFRLTLNADGRLTGVANQAEVRPKLQAMLDRIVQNLSSDGDR